jgi:hypothetical protein
MRHSSRHQPGSETNDTGGLALLAGAIPVLVLQHGWTFVASETSYSAGWRLTAQP